MGFSVVRGLFGVADLFCGKGAEVEYVGKNLGLWVQSCATMMEEQGLNLVAWIASLTRARLVVTGLSTHY